MGASLLLPLVVVGGMMFFMSRSQKKQQQQRQDLLNSMEVGSGVVTIGGLHGVVSEFNEEKSTVVLDCEGIFLEFNRSAIATVKPSESTTTTEVVENTTIETDTTEETTEDN